MPSVRGITVRFGHKRKPKYGDVVRAKRLPFGERLMVVAWGMKNYDGVEVFSAVTLIPSTAIAQEEWRACEAYELDE
jgi:hypothetical protein